MIVPGATPTHEFILPVSEEDVAALRITYEVNGKNVLQKQKEECTFNGTVCTTKLSQKETLLFPSNVTVRIQLKGRTTGGDVIISDIIKRPSALVLDTEEI